MRSTIPPDPKPPAQYCYCNEGEDRYYGEFDTREEALAEGRTGTDGLVKTGVLVHPGPPSGWGYDGEAMIEQIMCALADEAGESADNWAPCKAATEQLTNMMAKTVDHWFRETGQEWGFWMVRDIEEHQP